MAQFVWKSRLLVVDTDCSGRIHYTALFRHAEAAELEFMRSLRLPYRLQPEAKIAYPRVHVEADFSGPLRFDDLMEIAVSVERIGASSFTLLFDFSVDAQSRAKARIVVVSMDREAGRSSPLDPALSGALRDYVK
jgi:acyl-CoA thioester hydrolase